MLGKLMKYEFKATARIFLPVYAVLVALCLIGRLAENFEGIHESILFVIGVMLIAAAFCAVGIVTLVLIIRRFWDNLLGREGYLMHTLPAKEWQHILAKMFTSTVWCLCSTLAALLAIVILAGNALRLSLGDFTVFFNDLRLTLSGLRDNGLLGPVIRLAVEFVVMLISGSFSAILTVYLAMSIGQLANKSRVWAAIGSFVGIRIVVSLLLQSGLGKLVDLEQPVFISGVMWREVFRQSMSLANSALLWSIGVCLAETVVFFFATNWILSKRLNLK